MLLSWATKTYMWMPITALFISSKSGNNQDCFQQLNGEHLVDKDTRVEPCSGILFSNGREQAQHTAHEPIFNAFCSGEAARPRSLIAHNSIYGSGSGVVAARNWRSGKELQTKSLWTNIREMGQLCMVLRCWPQDALSYPQNCTTQRANFTEHKVRHRSIDTMMVGKSRLGRRRWQVNLCYRQMT